MNRIVIESNAIPHFCGDLKSDEKDLSPGPSLDLFLRLFEARCRAEGIQDFNVKRDKFISLIDNKKGTAFEIVLNNLRLEDAADWPSYEKILRALFLEYNTQDIHSIISEMIYCTRKPDESFALYEARISAHIVRAQTAAKLRGWADITGTLTLLAECLLLGESNSQLQPVGLNIPAPQTSLNCVIDHIDEKRLKLNIQNNGANSLHNRLRKQKEEEKPAQVSSFEGYKCHKCRSTFHIRRDCPYSKNSHHLRREPLGPYDRERPRPSDNPRRSRSITPSPTRKGISEDPSLKRKYRSPSPCPKIRKHTKAENVVPSLREESPTPDPRSGYAASDPDELRVASLSAEPHQVRVDLFVISGESETTPKPYIDAYVNSVSTIALFSKNAPYSQVHESFIRDNRVIEQTMRMDSEGRAILDVEMNGLKFPIKAHIVEDNWDHYANVILAPGKGSPPVNIDPYDKFATLFPHEYY